MKRDIVLFGGGALAGAAALLIAWTVQPGTLVAVGGVCVRASNSELEKAWQMRRDSERGMSEGRGE